MTVSSSTRCEVPVRKHRVADWRYSVSRLARPREGLDVKHMQLGITITVHIFDLVKDLVKAEKTCGVDQTFFRQEAKTLAHV